MINAKLAMELTILVKTVIVKNGAAGTELDLIILMSVTEEAVVATKLPQTIAVQVAAVAVAQITEIQSEAVTVAAVKLKRGRGHTGNRNIPQQYYENKNHSAYHFNDDTHTQEETPQYNTDGSSYECPNQ